MRIKRNDKGYKGQVIELIMEYGAVPYDVFRLCSGKKRTEFQRRARELKSEGVIREFRTLDGQRCLMLIDNQIDFSAYPSGLAEKYHDKKTRDQLRYLQIQTAADKEHRAAYRSTQNKIINDISAQLFMRFSGTLSGDSKYYTSVELKNVGNYQDKIEKSSDNTNYLINSRINGLLVTSDSAFSVYSTGRHLIEWKRFGEVKMASYIQRMLSEQGRENSRYETEAIILSKNIQSYEDIVKLDYKKQSGKRRVLMNIDYAYDHMYAVPYSRDGVQMLWIMQHKGWKNFLKDKLLTHEEQEDRKFVSVDCDGYDKENDIYSLVFLIPDMTRLKAFLTRARMEQDWNKYRIYCYKSQYSFISGIVGKDIKIYTVDIVEVMKEIRIGS